MTIVLVLVALVIMAIFVGAFFYTLSLPEEDIDPLWKSPAGSLLQQIASTDGENDGLIIMASDMSADQPMTMNLTFVTGYMVVGNWIDDDHFEAHIAGQLSSKQIAKVRALVSNAKNTCHVVVKHDTPQGPEVIYDS